MARLQYFVYLFEYGNNFSYNIAYVIVFKFVICLQMISPYNNFNYWYYLDCSNNNLSKFN
jgi:hypothetical protein